MQMRPEVQIQSMIKALTDVVLPAIDPANKLAQEQSRLVIGMLGLMARQLPLQFRFDCDELARLLRFAEDLQHHAGTGAATDRSLARLAEQATAAKAVLARAQAGPDAVLLAVRSLREASGAVVTAAFQEADPAGRARVQESVLSMSEAQLLRDRSWLLSQGWEPDPKAIPPIESLLAQ